MNGLIPKIHSQLIITLKSSSQTYSQKYSWIFVEVIYFIPHVPPVLTEVTTYLGRSPSKRDCKVTRKITFMFYDKNVIKLSHRPSQCKQHMALCMGGTGPFSTLPTPYSPHKKNLIKGIRMQVIAKFKQTNKQTDFNLSNEHQIIKMHSALLDQIFNYNRLLQRQKFCSFENKWPLSALMF